MMQQKNNDFALKRRFFMQILDCFIDFYNPLRGEIFRKYNPYLK